MVPKGRTPNRIKKYRCICGYTQDEVAEILGIAGANLVSQWERGKVAPSIDNLLKLCVLFHTLIEELYCERMKDHRITICTALVQHEKRKSRKM